MNGSFVKLRTLYITLWVVRSFKFACRSVKVPQTTYSSHIAGMKLTLVRICIGTLRGRLPGTGELCTHDCHKSRSACSEATWLSRLLTAVDAVSGLKCSLSCRRGSYSWFVRFSAG